MSNLSSTFPHELGIGTGAGLNRGATRLEPRLESLAEAEISYRGQRLQAEAERGRILRQLRSQRRQRRQQSGRWAWSWRGRSDRAGQKLMSGWTTWSWSIPAHRSSAEPRSSNACGN